MLTVDTSAEARGLDLPVLVMHRRGDLMIPLTTGGRDIAALIPNAELLVLQGNNHGPVADVAGMRAITDSMVGFFAGDLEPATVASP